MTIDERPPAPGAHVLMVVENMSVPADRRVWAEARALRGAGYRVSVISPAGTSRDTEPQVEIDGISIHRFPPREAGGGAWGYLLEYGTALHRIRRAARAVDRATPVDVVHLCNPPDILIHAVGALRRRGVPVVFDHHDLVPELFEARFGRAEGALYRASQRFERQTLRRANIVVSPNETYKRIAVERGGKRPEDVFVVRMAPDTERFSPGEPDPTLLGDTAHLIAYVGTMGPQDGVEVAVRALAALRERRRDWRAVLAGDGDAAPDVRRLVDELGLGDVVELPGFVQDQAIIRLLRTADVCLAPEPRNALNEASTMIKIVEYMSFAKPVVAFDLVEARASAGDGAAYAPEDTPESLAGQIDRLLDDPELRERMGAEGRRRITGELSWAGSTSSLLAAYERVLSR
jgi:glycosyltransferase involved in cell wall biosynthesis